ncbi:glycosyltransferase [Methylocystis sp. H62]|uniref:glycosyltransferase n=1 Tax=Methylocystis sp. H62 TaxID=2785789 RepID=UPI0018C216D8|nr:glycosyltransferase [Methylocystis sp. H62]MBG0794479.1 glycosyltransferase [Methylocystis sp. H62]
MIASLSWPFEAVLDARGEEIGWIAIHGPVLASAQQEQFAELRRKRARFLGVTSYLDFPRHDPRDPLDYEGLCEAWCHCFRDPNAYFTYSAPRALISVSDFTDWLLLRRRAGSIAPESLPAEFDYVYVGGVDPWRKGVKNWALAARCVPMIYNRLGLRALVIGEADEVFLQQPGVSFVQALPWESLLAAIAGSRFLLAPNRSDPSPRVLAEALCLDVPVVVDRAILGGWKYVNRFTGRFFDGEENVLDAARDCAEGRVRPDGWFRSQFGPELSGRRLATLLRSVDPGLGRDASLQLSAAGPCGGSPAKD